MRLWMICYDISDTRRRRQVATALADAGAQRFQESVFEGWFAHRDLIALFARVAPVVREDGGSLRIYPITSAKGGRISLGMIPSQTRSPGHWLC